MDILGRDRAALQKQLDETLSKLDETQKKLEEAHRIITDSFGKFTEVLEAAAKAQTTAHGASVLFLQNRKKAAVEIE